MSFLHHLNLYYVIKLTSTNSLNAYHKGLRFSIHRCKPNEYARLPRNLFWMVIETAAGHITYP